MAPAPEAAAEPARYDESAFSAVTTPNASSSDEHDFSNDKAQQLSLKPNWLLYSTVLISLLQPLQYGWSTSQLNLSQFNDTAECNAVPVAEGTCLMFPGHSKLEWTFAVNGWIFGGMIGSLTSGTFSDKWGRKKMLLLNCAFIIIGAVIQASVSNIWAFVVGRLVSGIASGVATGVVGSLINEVSPPHLRGMLGIGFQLAITFGILLVTITFFFANTSSGYRYIAGFPIILAGLFLLLSRFVVESPAWHLMKGHREEAKEVLSRLYGEQNVPMALAWLESTVVDDVEAGSYAPNTSEDHDGKETSPLRLLCSSKYSRQMAAAAIVACAQQLSGINAVFYYSSDMFNNAGIADDRVGSIIVDVVNVLPTFVSGLFAVKFGNRKMLLSGMVAMFVSAVGMTVSLVVDVSALSIVFTATYVAGFGISLGPLAWVVTADLFPDSVRATATSLCICLNWTSNLIVGVGYPYVADALDDYGFVPFVGTVFVFYCLTFKAVPETSGQSSEEIQAGFEARRKNRGHN